MNTTIKQLLLALTILLTSAMTLRAYDGDEGAKFLKACEEIPGISTIYISKTMLDMTANLNSFSGGVNVPMLAGKLDGLIVVSADESGEAKRLRQELKTISGAKGLETILKVRDDDEKIDMLMKRLPDKRYSYIIIIDEDDEMTVIFMEGTLTMQDVLRSIGR